MRRALDLPDSIIPKTICHTIATELRRRRISGEDISGLLGHRSMSRITEVYAKYDPMYLAEVKVALTSIYLEVMEAADRWSRVHSVSKVGNDPVKIVRKLPISL
jgi:hypothetical protein